MASNKKTVSVYADDDLLTALEEFKDSGNHKSLNVAIVAILREKLFGEVSGNIQSTLQSKVFCTLDIESIVNHAIASKTDEMRKEINDLKSTVNAVTKEFARYRDIEIDDLAARVVALETNRSEATAPANFTQALLQKPKEVAPLKLMELQKAA